MRFMDEDPEHRLLRETVKADHCDPKVEVTVEVEKLDFSFIGLLDVETLKTKDP